MGTIIPSLPGSLDYSDLLKHKKPCEMADWQRWALEEKGTGPCVVQRKVTGPLPRQPLAARWGPAGPLGGGSTGQVRLSSLP